jgi:hypothetical protein
MWKFLLYERMRVYMPVYISEEGKGIPVCDKLEQCCNMRTRGSVVG